MIPQELRDIKQWTYSESKEDLKRPKHYHYKPNGSLTFKDAKKVADEQGVSFGFYTTHTDPYILIDIDHIDGEDDIPKSLKPLIQDLLPTYCEFSPSGKGLRVIYKIKDHKDKANFGGHYFHGKEKFKDNLTNIQLNIGKPWMRMTGDEVSYSVSKISTIPVSTLESFINFRYKQEEEPEPEAIAEGTLPSIHRVSGALKNIPLDQNPRVKRAYEQLTGNEYHHYDFWLKMLMSYHDYAVKSDNLVPCFSVALAWSKTDMESFTSDKDVQAKWSSFSDKKNSLITYKTLFKVNQLCVLRWPVPRKQSKKQIEMGIKAQPVTNALKNFQALLKFFDFQFYRDSADRSLFYLTADEDITENYFIKGKYEKHFDKYVGPYSVGSFSTAALEFLEGYDFIGISTGRVKDFIAATLSNVKQEVNFFRLYFNTPFNELPDDYKVNESNYDTSTFEALWDCIVVGSNNREKLNLYKSFYKKWLYNFLRNQLLEHNEFQNNLGVLLLTGDEQIRKTTHFKCLFPTKFRDKILFTSHGFDNNSQLRDVTKISASGFVVVWDEFEQFLNSNTEASFKKIMDANPQTFIDKFEVETSIYIPKAIYGATSNSHEFKISGRTARRLLHIPVKWVHTSKMVKLCWYPIFHEIFKEFEGKNWLLTEDELDLQAHLFQNLKSKNEVDYALEEVFAFDDEFDYDYIKELSMQVLVEDNRLMVVTKVKDTIQEEKYKDFKTAALKHSLERVCSFWTKTTRRAKRLTKNSRIINGKVIYGNRTFYVMPPLKSSKPDDVFE